MNISVLIPTLNEARNIADCLASVAWSDDVVVVDSGSTDATVKISKERGARVVEFHWNGQFPKKKNWSLANVAWKHDWLLIVDADERITLELAHEIEETMREPGCHGYYINRRFIFMGRWIKHCGYYPSWNLRLFRHTEARYERLHSGDTKSGDNEVHEHVLLTGRSAHLKHDMLHYAYPDIHTWVEKHNRYSNWEAEIEVRGILSPVTAADLGVYLSARRQLRRLARHMPFRPALRFFYSYILKRGFLDGYEGYVFCRLLASYEMFSVFKAMEIRREERSPNLDIASIGPLETQENVRLIEDQSRNIQ